MDPFANPFACASTSPEKPPPSKRSRSNVSDPFDVALAGNLDLACAELGSDCATSPVSSQSAARTGGSQSAAHTDGNSAGQRADTDDSDLFIACDDALPVHLRTARTVPRRDVEKVETHDSFDFALNPFHERPDFNSSVGAAHAIKSNIAHFHVGDIRKAASSTILEAELSFQGELENIAAAKQPQTMLISDLYSTNDADLERGTISQLVLKEEHSNQTSGHGASI